MRFFEGLSNQQRDTVALNILLNPTPDPQLKLDDENSYEKLGEKRYLLALGEVIAEELVRSHGSQATAIAQGLWQAPSKYLAFDTRIFSREEIIKKLLSMNIKISTHPLANNALKVLGDINLAHLPEFRENIWFMDAGNRNSCKLRKT